MEEIIIEGEENSQTEQGKESGTKEEEDFLGPRIPKMLKAEIADQEYWKKVKEWQSLPLLRCQHCAFKTVYKHVLEHHMTYSHIRGHPSPPNIHLPFMCEKEIMDWEDAMANRHPRRSNVQKMSCDCATNPMNWPILGKECTCTVNEYRCEAHPRIDRIVR